MEGRYRGQSCLPQDRAQFQSQYGDRGARDRGRVEELVQAGELDPDNIHTPGIFVQRIIRGARYTK